MQFGTFIVGLLAEWFGAQIAIGSLAALMVMAMGMVYLLVPRIRDLE